MRWNAEEFDQVAANSLQQEAPIRYCPAFVTLSSRGLGHRPFTAVTRVRIPLGSPFDSAFTKASLMTTLRAANCKQGWRSMARRVEWP